MRSNRPEITKQQRGEDAYFTVRWSRLARAEKYSIITHVPSVAGIFELYYLDRKKTLNYIDTYRAWYGGLRHTLREFTDPEISKVPGLRALAKDRTIVFRYSESDSVGDIADVLFFFRETRKPINAEGFSNRAGADDDPVVPSGSYRYVYVNEESPDKLVTI